MKRRGNNQAKGKDDVPSNRRINNRQSNYAIPGMGIAHWRTHLFEISADGPDTDDASPIERATDRAAPCVADASPEIGPKRPKHRSKQPIRGKCSKGIYLLFCLSRLRTKKEPTII